MWRERIVCDPMILSGKPIVKGSRISVETILEELATGTTPTALAADLLIEEADVLAALEFASQALRSDAIFPAAS